MIYMTKNKQRFGLSLEQARNIVSEHRAKACHISRLLDHIEMQDWDGGEEEHFPIEVLADYFIDNLRWESCMTLSRFPEGRPPWWEAAAAAADRAD